jgi:hypothetical protein
MRGTKAEKKMNVIARPADGFRHSVECPRCTAQIGMQAFAPFGTNERPLVSGPEHDVDVKAEVRGGHGECFPALLRGARIFCWRRSGDVIPG